MFELNYEISSKFNEALSSRKSFYGNRHKMFPRNTITLNRVSRYSDRSSTQDFLDNAAFYQIASLIPDEVLLNPTDYEIRQFEAAVLFADISGFTELSEKYQNLENGASKLSAVLNFYLGIMVQEILSHDGDIIKYAGDAFIAIFRKEKSMSIQNSIHNAIDTAIIIQKNCRNYLTEVNVTLNVKIAISCGEVDFQLMGDESSSQYAIIGDPVWKVKDLQEFIMAGDILITWKAWHHAQESFYTYEIMRENRCYKITGFKELIGCVRRQYEATLNFQEMHKNLNKSIEAHSISNLLLDPGYNAIRLTANHNELFSLRQKISTVTSLETRKDLRRFIITPLLNAISMGDNIDALTEMRNVVIVFTNFIVPYKGSKEILSVTNRIYKKLYEIVKAYEGVLNKVLLFDKDMMFLIIFGLRGMQHENESAIGLKCAHELHQTFKSWDEIIAVSIGVTSGKSYCGVVGHTLRREYSVISVSVNRAARLMMAYPNVVSCDQVTLIESKIKLRYFKLLPKKSLKGISEAITVYEFLDGDCSDNDLVDMNYEVLVGKDELLESANKLLVKAITQYNKCSHMPSSVKFCLVIKGENGEGRTRVINYLYRDFMEQDIKCMKLSLNTKHSSTPFWTLKHCITKFIETEYGSEDELKNTITKKFLHLNIHKYLYLFNEIIDTNFDNNNVGIDLNETEKTEIQKQMIAILCKSLKNFWIILIDDADYIDLHSLKFINSIIMSQTIFVILAIGKNHKKWTLQHGKFIKNEHVTQYNLKPIDKTFQKDIACQSLNVSAIPIEFERFIHKNSNGNAGWIETCAKILLYTGKLKIKTSLYLQAVNDGMIMKNELNNDKSDFFDIPSPIKDSRQDDRVINVAVIEGVLCEKDYIVGYKNNKLMVYDTLSSYDQMICKCASVIGPKFYRKQLNYLITKIDYRHVGKTILKLFKLNILFCASLPNDEKEASICGCKNVKIFESCRDLPKYSNCTYMTFHDESFRNYVYDTLTEKQRIEYHRKCISYLCQKTTKCVSCNRQRFEIIDEIKFSFRDGIVKEDCKKSEMKEKVLKAVLPSITNQCNDIPRRRQSIVLNYMNYEYRNCKCRIYRQNIKFAIKIGEFAKKMCYNLGNHEALLNIIPSLFILYLKSFCIEDCYKLLQELHYSIKFNNNDENAKIWFYALCMDIYLDTKLDCVVDYDECKNIYIEAISIQSIEMNTEACLRFIINFSLWNAHLSSGANEMQ
ncbi:adenylate cyclase type 10-like [Chironomus tepperi]|uniref:adenylate cyclase type 10-like n=1 Tax=Chironomus tepperi TaxID=113505 RepID=UPI00391F5135